MCSLSPGPRTHFTTLIASGTSLTAPGSNRTRRVTSLPMASVFLNLWHTEGVGGVASPTSTEKREVEGDLNWRDAD